MQNGTQQIQSPLNGFYDRALLERAVPAFIHTRFAQVRDVPQGNTGTILFRRYINLPAATTPLVEGITPPGEQLTYTNLSATLSQYGDYVPLTDYVQMTTPDPLLAEVTDLLGDQVGDTLDQITRDQLNAGTNVLYASTATARNQITAAMKFTITEAKNAVRILKNNKAKRILEMIPSNTGIGSLPIAPSYIGFVHPDATMDLKAQTGYTPIEAYANTTKILPDEVGKMDEIRLVESPNAKIFTGAGVSSANVYTCIVTAQNAYGISRISGEALRNIIKPLGSAGADDPLEQRGSSGWKATFAAVRLNESFMIRIEFGTSQS